MLCFHHLNVFCYFVFLDVNDFNILMLGRLLGGIGKKKIGILN